MGKLSNAKKLTDAEKYAIQGMSTNGMSTGDIAKSLSRDILLVESYLEEYEQESKDTNITKTANGREGVAIMTEATSQRVDEMRKKGQQARERNPALHKIK